MSPEQLLQVADLYPDPTVLLTKEGVIVAANRGTAALGVQPKDLVGQPLSDLTVTPAEAVRAYLKLCARSREPVVGALRFRAVPTQDIHCRCYGSVVHHDPHGDSTRILLRLLRSDAAPNPFSMLAQKIDQLTKEVHRRQQAEAELRAAAERHRVMEESLTALIDASDTLTRTLALPAVSDSVLKLSQRLLPADAYAVWRWHPRSGQWHIVAALGLSEEYQRNTIQVLAQTSGMPEKPVVAEDVFALPMLTERKEAYRAEGIRSILVVPLRIHDQVCGTLVVYHRQRHVFSDIEVRVATAVANLSAAAIGSADLFSEAEEQRELLRVTLASIGDAVIATDTRGQVTYLNPVAETLTGWRNKEAQGRALEEVFPILNEETLQPVESPVRRALREGAIVGLANHTLLVARDGTRRPIDDSAAPIQDEQRRLVGVVLVFRDNTERRRAEQDARFLADASTALAGLVDYGSTLQKVARLAVPTFADWCTVDMLDEGGVLRRLAVAHVDPSKVELAHEVHRRYPPDPAAPRGVWNILRTGQSEFTSEITDELLVASVKDAELLRILRELGLKSYMGVPLTVRGRVLGVVTFIAAESGRRYDARDLTLAEDLAHRAGVAIENARLYQAVREADRRKDEFLALLGHELRNPLAPLRNALHVLKMPGADEAITRRTREMMERQVEYMVRLVDDLLDVSRIMRGKVELRRERIEIATIVARAVETAQPVIEAEGHQLSVGMPPEPLWVHGDLVRLAQVVSNLLTNAAKYTDRGGSIWLTAAREDSEAVVRVRDTGIGIAPQLLPRLFDMFFQAERRTKEAHGGLGIGLSLVRGLVELHTGTVEAHSDGLGKGSEFVIRLPLLHPAEETRAAPDAGGTPEDALPARRILVVDDNVDAADSLAMLLRLQGQEVEVAYDGFSALAKAEASPPAVAFLDLGMPKMDGYELARRFRTHPVLKEVILVALTGWGQLEDRQRTRAAGFDHHLVKPVDLDALRGLFTERG